VKEAEITTEKPDATTTVAATDGSPETPDEAPAVPAKDDIFVPAPEVSPEIPPKEELPSLADAAPSSTVVGESSSIAEESPPTVPEKPAELAPVAVEEIKAEKEEDDKNDSSPSGVVGGDKALNVEKELEESNAATEEAKPSAEATAA